MATKCSLMSKRPSVGHWPARSNSGRMSTRKYRYTIQPSSVETAYRTTMALAKEADGTARKRPKNEPGRLRAGAHAASVWWVTAPQRDRDQAMNDQKRGRQDALPSKG
jgi:hypothetical protein